MINKEQFAAIIRWTARIWGSVCIVFVLLMVGGELVAHLSGEPKFFIDSVSDLIGLLFFPIFCVGAGIAWKWEGLGGLIMIGAIVITQIVDGKLVLDLLTVLFAIPGLLFLVYWYLSGDQKGTSVTD